MKRLLAVLGVVVLAGAAAVAQTGEGMTLAEFLERFPEGTPDIFETLDADDDGLVTEEELEAGVEAGLIEDTEGVPD